uniref:Reverse transcriptase Ty1/copia-type domain-containing protein n=1 Tax=Chromera velia CCMP2878 TaxID=1169474 RepID=A0A0G4GQN4_9ALVE|eukprot:Cvel_5051.t1-p1 / transcript=Cvel_5051.t1 / gene=Cvel_5051 / organism=Chromera_velia_CCMP2878 / gene_product=Putative transposon Ty5-1 protein YCL074W, putative / transcript_product=Putative transposon Ty5-1 protein YCL074W, putative / location=Cvel_scaffold230:49473-52702(-) / protein_length=786 / sequence_SO=supercontig / SO=protein_coding / is_pseudo=false
MFGEKRADLSFLILSDSPVPFLFSKALAQRLSAVMDYRSDLMTIPSASGDPTELLWIDLGRYYAITLRQAPVFEASPAISVTLSPAGPPAAFMATVSAPAEPPLQEISVSDDDDDDCPSLCGSSDTASDCADSENACPNQGERDTVSLPPSFFATFIETGERFVFLLSNLQSLVMEAHCNCAHVGVEDVLSQLRRVFSFEVSVRSLREVVRKVLASCVPCSRVKGPVGFSIPRSSFNRRAYPGARLHMDTDPSSSASEPPLPSAPSGLLAPGTMVVASSPEHSLLWVGEVHGAVPSGDDSRDFLYEVHAWGTHQKCALKKRAWYPGHYVAGGSYVTYDSRGRRTDPEIVELHHSNVVASGFEIVKNRGARGSRLPSDLCARLSNGSRGYFFSQYPTSEPTDPAVHAAVNFLTSSDCSTSVFATTTHKPIRLSSLNSSEREGVREADAKEDKGWQDRQVYERVPLAAVPPDVQRVPLQQVCTEKLRDDGTRIFKTRTLALDLCKRRGVSLSLKKADVVQAYLQAPLPSSRALVYVLPPLDHPDRGHHLWKLLKAVYGLPDAGKVFKDFFSSKLRELGWSPTLFPGVWFLRGADGEIRGILCTYVDDLLLIGIGEDAADLSGPLRDHVVCGDDTDATSGCFVGVQFDVTADGILIHQHDYISSFSLPPEFSSSESRPADKPLPVGVTHKEDISPPLDAAGVRVYRELLGQVGYVAYCTRPDVSLAHSYLSRFMAAPMERAFHLLLQTIRYLRSTPSLGIPIRLSLNPDELVAVVYADASFGTPDSPHP